MSTLSPPPTSLLDIYTGSEILPLYEADVVVGGGTTQHARASGVARSSDGALDLALRIPEQLGGPGGGTNPEQLFAAGYAACFHGALSLIASKRKIKIPDGLEIAAHVVFGRDPTDGLFLITADLSVQLPGLDPSVAKDLIAETERICPYAKMCRDGIKHSVRLV